MPGRPRCRDHRHHRRSGAALENRQAVQRWLFLGGRHPGFDGTDQCAGDDEPAHRFPYEKQPVERLRGPDRTAQTAGGRDAKRHPTNDNARHFHGADVRDISPGSPGWETVLARAGYHLQIAYTRSDQFTNNLNVVNVGSVV
jgi:hypothetical protein